MILDITGSAKFVDAEELQEARQEAVDAMQGLINDYEQGENWLGWLSIAADIRPTIDKIEDAARRLRNDCEAVVMCGIGGSYLGAKAVIEALKPHFGKTEPEILFAGNNLAQDYIVEMSNYLKGKKFGIVCISKSGTTLETAIAFRVFRNQMEQESGEEFAARHIVCITDLEKGALHDIAVMNGYEMFEVPGNIGGRYSVLSAVGLLPIAVAGYDIRQLIAGAFDFYRPHRGVEACGEIIDYAALRNIMYRNGKKIELFVDFDPRLRYLGEWWKQLFGESEGKEGKGLFPASVSYTTDLHSLGQYVQEGERHLFETVVSVEHGKYEMEVPRTKDNLDKLNKYSWYTIGYINSVAEKGVRMAHIDGGVPNLRIAIPQINEYHLGQLIYFFELVCAVSGRMLGVNPFDQPGVEAYKANIKKLL
ncbi:MAG: glucose-6-phosphate isomerase [Paludibacteraceae bacterium]|nr:glucose-6-phosphate isomerase [Paludibacteraceae bacterium]